MKIIFQGKPYREFRFESEADFEREIVNNSSLFFGANTIYIDVKRKIETKSLGNSIPDGFLFDFSDREEPAFYLVEAELVKHDFYRHIFPQITKFFGFYKNANSQVDLVEKIFSIINNDVALKERFKSYLGQAEIYKFLKDTIAGSQNILIAIDGEKKELPEIMDTYIDTWGTMVKQIIIKKFVYNDSAVYSIHPEFENIEFAEIEEEILSENEVENEYTEEMHFENRPELIRDIYTTIKNSLLTFDPTLKFNPQKYYISIRKERNYAFFKFNKKKVVLVVKNSEEDTRTKIHHHIIKPLSARVQEYWNGPSCVVVIDSIGNIEEVIELLKLVIS
jgi:predicted transport protein